MSANSRSNRGWNGGGIATRLMAAAETWAADRGQAFLTLETGAANQPARKLYAALGYQEEDVRLTKAVSPSPSGQQPGSKEASLA